MYHFSNSVRSGRFRAAHYRPYELTRYTFAYTLNPAGQIASRSTSNTAYSFIVPGNGSVTSTANGRNQVTAIGANSVSHDSNGNVSAYAGTSYGYTSDNRLATAGSEHYAYDAAGRLYYQNSDGQVFHYDGHQLIMETNASAIVSRYVPGPGGDEPVVWYDGSGTSSRRWLHADERGSILAATDGSGALVGAINRYDDYGNVQGGSASERFGYAGQPLLASGLSYNRARMYNPALDGRFMQPDPIRYGGGMNLFAYAQNNPINFIDPSGLYWKCRPGVSSTYGGSDPGACRWIEDNIDRVPPIFSDPLIPAILEQGPFPSELCAGDSCQNATITATSRYCDTPEAFRHSGRVSFTGGTLGGAFVIGVALYGGTFRTESGISGDFYAIEFLGGARAEAAMITGYSNNLSTFSGGNDTISEGINILGLGSDDISVAYDLNGIQVGASTTIDGEGIDASFTGGFSVTSVVIKSCH